MLQSEHFFPFLCAIMITTLSFAQQEHQDSTSMIAHTSYPYAIEKTEIDQGIEIAYMDQGEGPYTLLFIHGLGSYAPAWNKNIRDLSEKYRCIALDLPGYGQSEKGDFAFSMAFFAEAVEEFIDSLELENVVLVGHSMGGQIAQTIAIRKQVELEKLVLVAPAGFEAFTEQDRAWFSQIATAAMVKATPNEMIQQNFNINFSNNQLPEDAAFMFNDRLRLKQNMAHFDRYCEMIPKCIQGMLEAPVFEQLPKINIPTLVFFGQEDYLIPNRILHPGLSPQAVAEAGTKLIPNSELKMLSPCGHFVQWECADEVNKAISEFLGF